MGYTSIPWAHNGSLESFRVVLAPKADRKVEMLRLVERVIPDVDSIVAGAWLQMLTLSWLVLG